MLSGKERKEKEEKAAVSAGITDSSKYFLDSRSKSEDFFSCVVWWNISALALFRSIQGEAEPSALQLHFLMPSAC